MVSWTTVHASVRPLVIVTRGAPQVTQVKNPPADSGDAGDVVPPLSWEDLLEKGMQPTPVFLPGKSRGQSSLVGCSLRDRPRVGHNLAIKQQQ